MFSRLIMGTFRIIRIHLILMLNRGPIIFLKTGQVSPELLRIRLVSSLFSQKGI